MSETRGIASELVNAVLDAIAAGKQTFLVWGISQDALQVLASLYADGLLSHVVALVDDDPTQTGRTLWGKEVKSPPAITNLAFDCVVVTSDKSKEDVLRILAGLDIGMPQVILAGTEHFEFNDPAFAAIVASCLVKSKAGGNPHMLIHLYQSLQYISSRKIPGAVAEFGVCRGGTTVFMAKVLRHFNHHAHIFGFDTFSGFPPRSNLLDLHRSPKDEFDDFHAVEAYCAPYDIDLVRGDIRETYKRLQGVPLALSFFDTDNYSGTREALPLCFDQTVVGGILAFDHYFSPGWIQTIGERLAITEVLQGASVFNLHGTGIFIKL